VGPLVGKTEQAAQDRQAVTRQQRHQDPDQVQGVEDGPAGEDFRQQVGAERDVEDRAVGDKLGAVAEVGELGDRLGGIQLSAEIRLADPGEPLDRQRDRHTRIDEYLEGCSRRAVEREADGADLDDLIAFGRQAGRLEIEGDQLGSGLEHAHAAGGGAAAKSLTPSKTPR
jgi:hypothetical protein